MRLLMRLLMRLPMRLPMRLLMRRLLVLPALPALLSAPPGQATQPGDRQRKQQELKAAVATIGRNAEYAFEEIHAGLQQSGWGLFAGMLCSGRRAGCNSLETLLHRKSTP